MRYDLIKGGLWQHFCKNRVLDFYVYGNTCAKIVNYFHLYNNRVPGILFLRFLQHLARVFHVIQEWFSTELSHLNLEEDYRG